jgi:hypothetical protein
MPHEATELQKVELARISKIDHLLKAEMAFVDEDDSARASSRLESLASQHSSRAMPQKDTRMKTSLPLYKLTPYYQLRLLRVRRVKRRLLGCLNFFVSIRRRLLCDLYGFGFRKATTQSSAPEAGSNGSKSADFSFMPSLSSIARGGPMVEMSVHELPTDMAMSREELIRFAAIEGRHDAYETENDVIQVRDSNGVKIMHSLAIDALAELDDEVSRILTHYIGAEHSDNLRADRLAMLDDIYEAELYYNQRKVALVEAYLESYEHAIDETQKSSLTELILRTISSRPSLDLGGAYFLDSYAECSVCLQLQHDLIRHIISAQIADERAYRNSILEKHGHARLWPPARVGSFPPHVVHSESALLQFSTGCTFQQWQSSEKIGVLDIYPSLGMLHQLPTLIEWAVGEIAAVHNKLAGHERMEMMRCALQQTMVEWRLLVAEGMLLSEATSNPAEAELQPGAHLALADDPFAWEAAIEMLLHKKPSRSVTTSKMGSMHSSASRPNPATKGVNDTTLDSVSQHRLAHIQCLGVVRMRQQLMAAMWETDVLRSAYNAVTLSYGYNSTDTESAPLEFDPVHARMAVENAEVSALRSDRVSKLALNELVRNLVQLPFGSVAGMAELADDKSLADLRLALQVQLVERLVLMTGLQYSYIALDRAMLSLYVKDQKLTANTGGTLLTRNFFGDNAAGAGGGTADSSDRAEKTLQQLKVFFGELIGKISHHYLSLNRMKLPLRKQLVYAYQQQRDEVSDGLKGSERANALRKLKLSLVWRYCEQIIDESRPYMLKVQINHSMRRLDRLVNSIPVGSHPFIRGADPQQSEFLPHPPLLDGFGKDELAQSSIIFSDSGTLESPWVLLHPLEVIKSLPLDASILAPYTTLLLALTDIIVLLAKRADLNVVVEMESHVENASLIDAVQTGYDLAKNLNARAFEPIVNDLNQLPERTDIDLVTAWYSHHCCNHSTV